MLKISCLGNARFYIFTHLLNLHMMCMWRKSIKNYSNCISKQCCWMLISGKLVQRIQRRDTPTSISFDHLSHASAPRRSRTAENAEQIRLLKQTMKQILIDDLKMRKLCSVWVPQDLTVQKKLQRVESDSVLQRLEQHDKNAAGSLCRGR